MKAFEERSARYQRLANRAELVVCGGLGVVLAAVLVLAFVAMLAMGAYALLTRVL